MRIAINQSNYIPWRGYFDMIDQVDAFVLLDDVQYTRQDWRNRNRLKTARGLEWLSVPISRDTKSWKELRVDEALLAKPDWVDQHWAKIEDSYRDAACFETAGPGLRAVYEEARSLTHLVQVNHALISYVAGQLGITTPLHKSTDFEVSSEPTQRLIDLCRALDATTYLSGPAAQAYLDQDAFAAAGITIEWMDYSGYPEYPQPHGDFESQVSVIDLLLNTGDEAAGLFHRPR